jgi:hypothetical protein
MQLAPRLPKSAANGRSKKDDRLLETLGLFDGNLAAGSRTFTLGKIGRRK